MFPPESLTCPYRAGQQLITSHVAFGCATCRHVLNGLTSPT